MAQTMGALINGMPTAGVSLQDLLDKSAPGLGFLPSFMKTWFKVDISQVIALVSLIGIMSNGFDFLNRVAVKLYWWVTRFCTASVSISGADRLNREVLNWLSATVLTRQGTRVLAARAETIDNDSWGWRQKTERDDYHHERRRPVEYLPTFGSTWFWHRLRLFVVHRIPHNRGIGPRLAAADTPAEYVAAPDGREPLVVMCFGRSVQPIKRFLDDCRDFADSQRRQCITIRACKSQYHTWTWDTTILRPIRPIETVHFDAIVKAELVRDVTNYLDPETRHFYHQRGIPYRRGYLLYGPPGTGKTSLSLALAGMFGLELYLLHIPSMSSDKELEALFAALPPRCIVLLEDIDAVGIKRKNISAAAAADDDDDEDAEAEKSADEDDDDESSRPTSRTTLSGLLNVLDGVASQEGRIVLMTSNVAESLDPALVRPGRIDKKIFLGNISRDSARLMFRRMFRSAPKVEVDEGGAAEDSGNSKEGTANSTAPTTSDEEGVPDKSSEPSNRQDSGALVEISPEDLERLAAEFAESIPERTFTPALLQGFLLSHKADPWAAAREIPDWSAGQVEILEAGKALAKKLREKKAKRRRAKRLKLLAKMAEEKELSMLGLTDDAPKSATADAENGETAQVPEEEQMTVNGAQDSSNKEAAVA